MKNKKNVLTEAPRAVMNLMKSGKRLSIPKQWLGKNGKVAAGYQDQASRITNINKAADQLLAGREAGKLLAKPEEVKTVMKDTVTEPGKKILGITVKKPTVQKLPEVVKDTHNADEAKKFMDLGKSMNTRIHRNYDDLITGRPLAVKELRHTTGPQQPLPPLRQLKPSRPLAWLKAQEEKIGERVAAEKKAAKKAAIKDRIASEKESRPLAWLKAQEEKIADKVAARDAKREAIKARIAAEKGQRPLAQLKAGEEAIQRRLDREARRQAQKTASKNAKAAKRIENMFEPYSDAFEA